MSSNRSTLHASKLDAFLRRAKSRGYTPVPTKGAYEVARLDPPDGDSPLIFYKRDRTDHVTVPADATSLVNRYIRFVRQSRIDG